MQQVEERNPKLLALPTEFQYLSEASNQSVEGLCTEITSLSSRVKSIAAQVENDPALNAQIREFLDVSSEISLDLHIVHHNVLK